MQLSLINMILLQAAMMAGYIMFIGYGIFLFIGIVLLISPCMKLFRNLLGRPQEPKSDEPFYKYPLTFILSLLVSASLTTFAFFGFVFFLGSLFRGFAFE